MHGTWQNAKDATQTLLGRCEIMVLDSQTMSVGLALLAEAAARYAEQYTLLDDVVRGEKAGGHPIVIKRFRDIDSARDCQLLFVGGAEPRRLDTVMSVLKDRMTLTVATSEPSAPHTRSPATNSLGDASNAPRSPVGNVSFDGQCVAGAAPRC